ncbi:MAG: molybdopterin dinucleotide binding domain-containing protein [Thermodesulfobacteriota bacterium]
MSGWDRRTFLATGAFGTAGLALDNKRALLGSAQKPWNAGAGRTLRKFRDPAPTVCRMCPAHCGVVAFRDGDRVVHVQGNPGAPTNQGGICVRALAGLERVYDAERQLHPLRRAGPRGSGEWTRISWEDALAELGRRLEGARGRSVLHLGEDELLVEDFRDELGWKEVLVDRPLPGRSGPGSGESWYGAPVLGAFAAQARGIFLFGLRPLDGRFLVPLARDVVRAREHGGSLYLFDSMGGSTGSLAEWHPVAPGTEAVVAYGLARLLLSWGAYDAARLRQGVADAPEALRAALEAYTPEAVQEAAGVPAAALVNLARAFSERKPALALAPHASPAAPAVALLNHLAGTVNQPGGVATARRPFFLKALRPSATPEAWWHRAASGAEAVPLYWAVEANPAYDVPGVAAAEALADPSRVAFLVAMDTHLTETASLADLFLPRATHFECWDLLEGCLPDGRPYLSLQQPVTRPASEPDKLRNPDTAHLDLFSPAPRALGQSRSMPDVLIALARARPEATFAFPTTRDYLFEVLRKSWGPGSLEALARRGIWVSGETRPPVAPQPVSLLSAIPAAVAPPPDSMFLLRYDPATLPRTYANTRWGREIAHRFEALLHPQAARHRGIRNGDTLSIRSSQGTVTATARIIQGIHPRVVALPDGFGHRAGGSVARAMPRPPGSPEKTYLVRRRDVLTNPLGLSAREVEPGEPIWWSKAGPGASANSLFPLRLDGGGLQEWGALPVEVRRA